MESPGKSFPCAATEVEALGLKLRSSGLWVLEERL